RHGALRRALTRHHQPLRPGAGRLRSAPAHQRIGVIVSQAPGFYLTTSIPYVNGAPHLGHALEFVQADVLARHRRLRGDDVRYLSGTDENAFTNVQAAAA